jgi:hypothetical protein
MKVYSDLRKTLKEVPQDEREDISQFYGVENEQVSLIPLMP